MSGRVEGASFRGAGGVWNGPALGLVDEGTVGPGQVLHLEERGAESSHWRGGDALADSQCTADCHIRIAGLSNQVIMCHSSQLQMFFLLYIVATHSLSPRLSSSFSSLQKAGREPGTEAKLHMHAHTLYAHLLLAWMAGQRSTDGREKRSESLHNSNMSDPNTHTHTHTCLSTHMHTHTHTLWLPGCLSAAVGGASSARPANRPGRSLCTSTGWPER